MKVILSLVAAAGEFDIARARVLQREAATSDPASAKSQQFRTDRVEGQPRLRSAFGPRFADEDREGSAPSLGGLTGPVEPNEPRQVKEKGTGFAKSKGKATGALLGARDPQLGGPEGRGPMTGGRWPNQRRVLTLF
ncbi:hypothetical protein BU23DRAFT_564913 [Bimuria novae-zelandiae CBS 107.79]|uniref:Uncharacterized protein n=1 Tax=Bimuria novae-zelandiae CBS 107.79 TaxID=1447943 RepID=A0A6A5VNX8_9PLEO|nr:hypothetical protein BU23DRAFT_564913 [Bimuria novae-zelandiae CBS 107.79]